MSEKGSLLIGIDEAGRGALAGPLYVAAVLGDKSLNFSKDSKSINAEQREELFKEIEAKAEAIGVGRASAAEIDTVGLAQALTKAARDAFSHLSKQDVDIVIDGPFDFLKLDGKKVETIVDADKTVPQVSAASIVAKVLRDRFMKEANVSYPGWGFERHVGYGTKEHLKKLENTNPTPLHRRSFKPLSNGRMDWLFGQKS